MKRILLSLALMLPTSAFSFTELAVAVSGDLSVVTTGKGPIANVQALQACSDAGGSNCGVVMQASDVRQCLAFAVDAKGHIGKAIWGSMDEDFTKATAIGKAIAFCGVPVDKRHCRIRALICNHY